MPPSFHSAELGGYFLGKLQGIESKHLKEIRGLGLWIGIELDKFANERSAKGARVISSHSSAISVLVVPTNEELEIARQSLALVSGA